MSIHTNIRKIAIDAKGATFAMAKSSFKQRNGALKALIENLHKDQEMIFQANRNDIAIAKENGLNAALLERLSLEGRLEGIIHDIEQVARQAGVSEVRGNARTHRSRAEDCRFLDAEIHAVQRGNRRLQNWHPRVNSKPVHLRERVEYRIR